VRSFWLNYEVCNDFSATHFLVQKLKSLKEAVAQWRKEKKKKLEEELSGIEK